jgi:D-alanyl-D-alanine carboxypeptidase
MNTIRFWFTMLFMTAYITACSTGSPASPQPGLSQTPNASATAQVSPTPEATVTPTHWPAPTPIVVEGIGQDIEKVLETSNFSGAALVVRQGEVLYRGGLGFADAETGRPNTPETRFKLGSVHKQLSAALVLTLARDGLIDLNGSLCQRIPECPESLANVTYHQVLTHSSGIGELTDEEGMQIQSNADALRIIGDKERLFEPGQGWSYSNTAYSLFTATPEMILGKSLIELEQNLYEAAGMSNTGLEGFEGPPADSAVGYSADGSPAGDPVGNWSTVDDLWAWHRALLAGDPIPSDLVALMEKPHVQVEDALWYGYGVEVRETHGRREISHRGGTAGFSSYLIRFPDDDVVIVLLSNQEFTDVDSLRERLIDIVFTK